MDKALLRKQFSEKRNNLSRSQYWLLMDLLMNQVRLFDWTKYKTIHMFLPIKKNHEIDTFSILDFFKNHHPTLQIVIPRTDFQTFEMENVLYDHEQTILVRNKFDIPEPIHGKLISPDQIDLVFLPLLACDKQGNRVGYGKGFYDRFLSKCRPDIQKVGISFFDPIDKISDLNEFDKPLDCCICPEKIWKF